MSLDSLKPFLEPRSIAMIGASENPNKIGGRPIAYLRRYGFKGKVYPINPTRKELQGQACYPSLADLPEVPDLAVVAVPGDNAIARREGLRGARREGRNRACRRGSAKRRPRTARPRSARWSSGRARRRHAHGRARTRRGSPISATAPWPVSRRLFTAVPQADGPIAMVSQSGAMSAVPVGLLRQSGLGVRYSLGHRQRCRRDRGGDGRGGRQRSGHQAAAALSGKHPAARAAGRGGAHRARARRLRRGAEVGPHRRGPARGALAYGRACQRGSCRRCGTGAARHLARARRGGTRFGGGSLSQGLEAEGPPARGHLGLRRNLRDGGGCRDFRRPGDRHAQARDP